MRTSFSHAVLCAVLAFAACDHTPPPTPPALDAETARQLFEHMEELVAALRTRSAAPVHGDLVAASVPAVATPERTLADASVTALHERLEALEREVAQLRTAAQRQATVAPRATLPPPRNTASVELAINQLAHQATRAEARRSFFMLSMQQVLDQFGVPDGVGVDEDGRRVKWSYQIDKKALELTFYDGIVINIDIYEA